MESHTLLIPKEKKKHLVSVRLIESSWKVLEDAKSTYGLSKTEAIEAGLLLLNKEISKRDKDNDGHGNLKN